MVLSVLVFADEADGAGLVWRAVSKLNSLVSDLGDVAGGCSNGQTLSFQSSNSTFICSTAGVDTDTTNVSTISPSNATLVADNTTSTNNVRMKNISAGTGIQIDNGTNSVIIKSTVTDTDTNTTVLSSISNTNATLIADNSTSTNNVRLKGISAGTGIQIDNGTNSVIIKSTIVDTDTGFTTIASEIATSNNATLVANNSTVTNRASIKTLSAGAGITLTNNTGSVQINATNPYYTLDTDMSVTTSGSALTQIFRVPLSADKANFISGTILTTTQIIGIGTQVTANITQATSTGTCWFLTPTTTGTTIPTTDIMALNTTSSLTDTAETTSGFDANVVKGIQFQCSVSTGSTAGDLRLFFQSETEGSTVTIKNGTYYIKSP